jgi:hypothetical protein
VSDFPPPDQPPSSPSWGPTPPQSWGAQPPPGPPGATPPPPPPGYTPYQGGGYGAPVYGPNPFESRGTTVLVIGILSLAVGVLCGVGFLLGPVAWVMGNNLKSEAEAAGFPEPGNGKAGRICGIIGTALMVVGIVLFVLFLMVGSFSFTTTGS